MRRAGRWEWSHDAQCPVGTTPAERQIWKAVCIETMTSVERVFALSPELIHRALSPDNGFRVETVLLHEVVPGGARYFAIDPDRVLRRVEPCSSRPDYILTIARKVAEAEVFATTPQQSDYVGVWTDTEEQHRPSLPSLPGIRKRLPRPLKHFLKDRLVLAKLGFDQPCFRRLDAADVLRGKLA